MSERVIIAAKPLTCDICGRRIAPGTKCRLIKDDYMPGIEYFEHLRCPSAPATALDPHLVNPKQICTQ